MLTKLTHAAAASLIVSAKPLGSRQRRHLSISAACLQGGLAMGVQIPPVLVLIVCKTVLAGPPDQNAAFTHWENLEWATEHSMMVCRRNEIQLYDPVEGMKLNPVGRSGAAAQSEFRGFWAMRPRRHSAFDGLGRQPTETRPGASGGSAAHRPSSTPGQEP